LVEKKTVLGLVGSPNPEGRTNEVVSAALASAARAGAAVEKVQMSEYVVEPCRDCLPWVCLRNLKCSYKDDNLAFLSEKILDCGALILGTPVYWWDTSAMVKFLILKMFRIYAMSGPLAGLPAFGIGIAGGTGNGLISGLRPVYHFFQIMQMRALAPVPVTRFDMPQSIARAEELGTRIAAMAEARVPFQHRDEGLLWYDRMPYINEDRVAERRLLAAITIEAVPEERRAEIAGDLARADILTAAGETLPAMAEIGRIYGSATKIITEIEAKS
jgi:multimeric flavodoxin WrbA